MSEVKYNRHVLGIENRMMLEEEAAAAHKNYPVPDNGNIDMVALVRHNGCKVQRMDMDNCNAMLICNKKERIIAVNLFSDKAISRWLVAKEFARYLLNKDKTVFAHEDRGALMTAEDFQADYLANALLIPKNAAEKMYDEISRCDETNQNEHLQRYAKQFGVPEMVVTARYMNIMALRNADTSHPVCMTSADNSAIYSLEDFYDMVFSGEICTGNGYGYFVSESGNVVDDVSPTPSGLEWARENKYPFVQWHSSYKCPQSV